MDPKRCPVILCIDDEMNILRSLERCLSADGVIVHKALGGAEAMALLHQLGGKVDLVIIDQKMPDMTGEQFLKAAHEKYGQFPSIMLSGYVDIEELSRVVKVGNVVRFMGKPWSNQELLQVVRGVVPLS